MKLNDLKKIIDNGENENVEFKETFSNAVITSLNAFVNTSGGMVVIGVSEKKTVMGVTIGKETIQVYRASTRNKLLAEALYLTNDIEKYGSGYIRIRKEIEQYPSMRFSYNEIANGYVAELSYDIQKTTTDANNNVTVNPENVTVKTVHNRSKEIIEEIKKHPNISATELSVKFNVTERTIKRDLQILKENDVIIRVGSDKTGYWNVL